MGGTALDQHHRHALSDRSQKYLLSIFIPAHGLQIDQEFIREFFLFPELCEKSRCAAHADRIRFLVRNGQKQNIPVHSACPIKNLLADS